MILLLTAIFVASPLIAWRLQVETRAFEARLRLRRSTPFQRIATAFRRLTRIFGARLRPAMRQAAFVLSSMPQPPVHRWYYPGEPPCTCPACPNGGRL